MHLIIKLYLINDLGLGLNLKTPNPVINILNGPVINFRMATRSETVSLIDCQKFKHKYTMYIILHLKRNCYKKKLNRIAILNI